MPASTHHRFECDICPAVLIVTDEEMNAYKKATGSAKYGSFFSYFEEDLAKLTAAVHPLAGWSELHTFEENSVPRLLCKDHTKELSDRMEAKKGGVRAD